MNRIMAVALILSASLLAVSSAFAQAFDVSFRGIDDGVKTNKQQDYKEAITNAKLQLLERVEQNVDAIRRITNFQLRYETVEAKAKKVLLPGFQIVDIGYVEDGTYQVVLVGKAQKGVQAEKGGNGAESSNGSTGTSQEIQDALQHYKNGNTRRAMASLNAALSGNDPGIHAEALFLRGMMYADDFKTLPRATRTLDELRMRHPDSPLVAKLETVTSYKLIQYKIVNNEHKIKKSKSIVNIKNGRPFTYTYKDETGTLYDISFPSGSVCINDECGKFERRGIKDRHEANVGRFNFFKRCTEWTDYNRAQMDDSAVDKVCVMTIERTDLSIESMLK